MFAPGTEEPGPAGQNVRSGLKQVPARHAAPANRLTRQAYSPRASDHTKARYAFVYGDFRRLHRMGIIACHYRAAEWRHKEIELAAHDLLQRLDRKAF